MKFRTEPEGEAFMKPVDGGGEKPCDNKSDALHEAFLSGHEITEDEYRAD